MLIVPGFDKDALKENEKREFGLWVFYPDSISCKCSSCNTWAPSRPDNFCGHCGAMMVNKVDAVLRYELEFEKILEAEKSND